MTNTSPLFIIIPMAAAFIISLLGKRAKHLGDILANLASFALLLLSFCTINIIHKTSNNILIYTVSGWVRPIGISLVLDGLSSFMLLTVNLISFLVLVYAISYMKKYSQKWKFYTLFMLMLSGLNGIILSGDIFNLYLFLELASISGYILVAFGTEQEDLEASFKYAILGSIASVFILLAIGLLYSYTSTLNMADIASSLSSRPPGLLIGFVSVLFLTGFGLKAALVPFHAWLPDAHSSAPTPVSATLSGVFIKTAGIYALARVFFNVLGVSNNLLFALVVLGVLSMVVGAILAIGQSDIKRMFAYSSISQIGYIVFALGIASPLAILGALLHLFNHAVFKSLLFLNAGSIEYSTNTRDLNKLGGLNSRLPVTGFTGLLGSMSISGVPPLAGFWSKLIIIIAAVQAGYIVFAFVAVLISIVTLIYYLRFQTYCFFGKLNREWQGIKEGPFTMKLPMIALALICLIAGLLLVPVFRPFLQSAANALSQALSYKDIILRR